MPSEPSAGAIRPTPVELQILEMIVLDLTNHQIATRLHLSINTIKTHIRRLIALTKVESRTGLAVAFIWWKYLGQPNLYWDEPIDVYSQMGNPRHVQER